MPILMTLFVLICSSWAPVALGQAEFSEPWEVKIIRENEPKKQVALKVPERTQISLSGQGKSATVIATFEVELQKNLSLVSTSAQVKVKAVSEKIGKSRITLPLKGKETKFQLRIVDPYGKVESEEFRIVFPKWPELKAKYLSDAPIFKRHHVSAAVGLSLISYRETDHPYNLLSGFTPKLAYLFYLNPRWEIGFNAYITAIPMSTSRADGQTGRFFGTNFRSGYEFPISSALSMSLVAGWYYTTMLSTNGIYGFNHMTGPMIFPNFKLRIARSTFTLYFKFSPILGGQGFRFDMNELASGIAWIYPLGPIALSTSLDFSQLTLKFDDGAVILTQSGTLGVGVGFSF